MPRYQLLSEPSGDSYRSLVAWMTEECEHALLILRNGTSIAAGASEVLAQLEPHLISTDVVTQWPGTQLLHGATAKANRYQTSHVLMTILQRRAESLYDWCQPGLPEDLCFLGADGEAILTITHERYAEIRVDDAGLKSFMGALPQVTLRLVELA